MVVAAKRTNTQKNLTLAANTMAELINPNPVIYAPQTIIRDRNADVQASDDVDAFDSFEVFDILGSLR